MFLTWRLAGVKAFDLDFQGGPLKVKGCLTPNCAQCTQSPYYVFCIPLIPCCSPLNPVMQVAADRNDPPPPVTRLEQSQDAVRRLLVRWLLVVRPLQSRLQPSCEQTPRHAFGPHDVRASRSWAFRLLGLSEHRCAAHSPEGTAASASPSIIRRLGGTCMARRPRDR